MIFLMEIVLKLFILEDLLQKLGIDESIINIAEDLDLLPKEVRYHKRNTRS